MAKTVNDVLAMAKASINDPQGKRFTPTAYLAAFNRSMHRLFTERPDLFVGSLTAALTDRTSLAATLPYDDEYAQLHADVLISDLELVADEATHAARAQVMEARAKR